MSRTACPHDELRNSQSIRADVLSEHVDKWHCSMRKTVYKQRLILAFDEMEHHLCKYKSNLVSAKNVDEICQKLTSEANYVGPTHHKTAWDNCR